MSLDEPFNLSPRPVSGAGSRPNRIAIWAIAAIVLGTAITGITGIAARTHHDAGKARLRVAIANSGPSPRSLPSASAVISGTPKPQPTSIKQASPRLGSRRTSHGRTTSAAAPRVEAGPGGDEQSPSQTPPAITVPDPAPGGLVVVASDTAVPTATDFEITVKLNYRSDVAINLETGDGTWHSSGCFDDTRYRDIIDRSRSGTITTVVFRWSYRQLGHYTLTAHARTACENAISSDMTTARTGVAVADGVIYSNGPHAPDVHFGPFKWDDLQTDPDPYMYMVGTDAYDLDGWVGSVIVDFGDGSEPNKQEINLSSCHDYQRYWIPGGFDAGNPHRFPGPGTYTVTARVTSSDCTGSAEQTSVRSETVTVPS